MAAVIPCLSETSSFHAWSPIEPIDLPFSVKRVFYIYGVPRSASRGGHSHRRTRLAIFCLSGECKMLIRRENREATFNLRPQTGGILVEPGEWHRLFDFIDDPVLLVLASRRYEPEDYVYGCCQLSA